MDLSKLRIGDKVKLKALKDCNKEEIGIMPNMHEFFGTVVTYNGLDEDGDGPFIILENTSNFPYSFSLNWIEEIL